MLLEPDPDLAGRLELGHTPAQDVLSRVVEPTPLNLHIHRPLCTVVVRNRGRCSGDVDSLKGALFRHPGLHGPIPRQTRRDLSAPEDQVWGQETPQNGMVGQLEGAVDQPQGAATALGRPLGLRLQGETVVQHRKVVVLLARTRRVGQPDRLGVPQKRQETRVHGALIGKATPGSCSTTASAAHTLEQEERVKCHGICRWGTDPKP